MQVTYQDIFTMPIYNWFKLLDQGNLGFLFVDSTNKLPNKVEHVESEELMDLWHDLNNQFFDEFGQSSINVNLLEKKRELGLLYARYLVTDNKMNLTFIDIKKNEIESLTKGDDDGFNYNKEVGILSKYMGTMINIKTTSVHQYNTIKETLKDG